MPIFSIWYDLGMGVLGPNKPLGQYSRKELGVAILRCAALGIAVVLVASSPYAASAFLRYFRTKKPAERHRLARRVKSLEAHGYFIRKNNGEYLLTEKAREILAEDDIWSLKVRRPKRWDRKWRIVIFDIPAKYERGRRALRLRLQELDCVAYQRSVYVYPFELKSEV